MDRSLARLAHHPVGLSLPHSLSTHSHFHSLSTYCVPVFVTDPGGAPVLPGPQTTRRAVSRGPEVNQGRRPRRGTCGEGCVPLSLGGLHRELRGHRGRRPTRMAGTGLAQRLCGEWTLGALVWTQETREKAHPEMWRPAPCSRVSGEDTETQRDAG